MRTLIISSATRRRIDKVRQYAEAHPLTMAHMLAAQQGRRAPIGDNRKHRVSIDRGYLCAFSIEPTIDNEMVRHLSVSVDTPGKLPSVPAVSELMTHFGFLGNADSIDMMTYVEQNKGICSVNVIQRYRETVH